MPLENRVLPTGEIVSAPWRGAMMGNRGILHGPDRRLGRARWRHKNWVCCVTEFRGRWREPMPEGRYTALFFWDEAAAFAAGHRPCAECRWRDYQRFKAAWAAAGFEAGAARAIDAVLHAARIGPGRLARSHEARRADLPEGVFFRDPDNGAPVVQTPGGGLVWTAAGYRPWAGRSAAARVDVLTPAPVVAAFRAGYRPEIRVD